MEESESAVDDESFQIFPKEIWEMILDEVEDSKDLQSLLKVFPSLDESFQERKRYWLIGQVISQLIIYKLIDEQDILNCREICKQWSRRIDRYLDDQPVFRAYLDELHKDIKEFWEPIEYNCRPYIGGVLFHTEHQKGPSKFMEDMRRRSPSRNPFLSRSLSIVVSDERHHRHQRSLSGDLQKAFWENLFLILERFGGHIFFLNFELSLDNTAEVNPPSGHWKTLIKILNLLPNLKLLRLKAEGDQIEQILFPNGLQEIPKLPHLETLKIMSNTFPSHFIHSLLSKFGGILRRLEMPMDYWRPEYNGMFPNLTDIDINDETLNPLTTKKSLQDIPKFLSSPKLVKLQLGFSISNNYFDVKETLFKWLQRFPSLKYLNIGDDCRKVHPNIDGYFLMENGSLDPSKDSIPSLQFLVMRDWFQLSYNFLRCLPSLRHLIIFIRKQPMVTDLSIPEGCVMLREQIQTGKIYESNVWEHLKQLKTVTLLQIDNYDGELEEQFDFERETYEKMKKAGKTRTTEFSPLRPDILAFLGYFDEIPSDEESYLSEISSEEEEERRRAGREFDDEGDDEFFTN